MTLDQNPFYYKTLRSSNPTQKGKGETFDRG